MTTGLRAALPACLVLAGLACLAGCGFGMQTISCPSWAGFPTPQDKYDAADLVVVATSASRDGTSAILGVEAHAYDVQISDLLKGDAAGSVRVSSMPDPCSGRAEYPGGDPLDMSGPTLVFASQQDGEWFTLTPYDGTLPASQEIIDALAR